MGKNTTSSLSSTRNMMNKKGQALADQNYDERFLFKGQTNTTTFLFPTLPTLSSFFCVMSNFTLNTTCIMNADEFLVWNFDTTQSDKLLKDNEK